MNHAALLATLCVYTAGVAPADADRISPSPACSVSFTSSSRLNVRKIDDQRLEVTWSERGEMIKSEMRVGCGPGVYALALTEAGFSNSTDGWKLAAGSGAWLVGETQGGNWQGIGGTYFQSNVCRSVIGRSPNQLVTFMLDFCVAEDEYQRSTEVFDTLERDVIVGVTKR
jgi:hypothetical protein